MDDDFPSPEDLLLAWQDATRAADLADRLARVAVETSELLTANAVESERVAALAERVASAAEKAATTAREAATRARNDATRASDTERFQTENAAEARAAETAARERHQERVPESSR